MPRRLPDPVQRLEGETDEQFQERWRTSKRRKILFRRCYQNYYVWRAQIESGDSPDILTLDGEEVYFGNLLVGMDSLPPRQRQAFELICMLGFTEGAATRVMLPDSKWSTPVQQYADQALVRMIAKYDEAMAGKCVSPSVLSPASATDAQGALDDDDGTAQHEAGSSKGRNGLVPGSRSRRTAAS